MISQNFCGSHYFTWSIWSWLWSSLNAPSKSEKFDQEEKYLKIIQMNLRKLEYEPRSAQTQLVTDLKLKQGLSGFQWRFRNFEIVAVKARAGQGRAAKTKRYKVLESFKLRQD